MNRTMKKCLPAVIAGFLALGFGAAAHAVMITGPEHPVSLAGEKSSLNREAVRKEIGMPAPTDQGLRKMGPHLQTILRRKMAAAESEPGGGADAEPLRIVLTVKNNREDVLRSLQEKGVHIVATRKNLAAVEVPVDQIEEIVNSAEDIEFARLPHRFRPLESFSEGVALTGAQNFHARGYEGLGVKVAVIDVGFKGLSQAQASGDLPYDVTVRDYTGRGLQTQYLHGTACAEIVHDMAPRAQLYLLKIYDEVDIYLALDYCVANNIDIISASLGTFGSGPGNGTGPIDEAVSEVRAHGILVVAAAGNEADGSHWQGPFTNTFGDDIHEFNPGDDENGWYNVVAAIPYKDDDGNPETNDLTVIMRWNNWPAATIDYDLYLFDYYSGDMVGYSTFVQDGAQPPLEGIVIDLPDKEDYWHVYALLVTRKPGEPAGTDIELSLGGTTEFVPFWEYPVVDTPASSVSEPADAKSVFAVGAIDYTKWTAGPLESFSSRGPTNAWAGVASYTKPDISGPDGTSGSTYGSSAFFGTSAATPHVAGAAALILSMSPQMGPGELQTFLEESAVDMGAGGKDNLYGWGRLQFEIENRGLPWMLLLMKNK